MNTCFFVSDLHGKMSRYEALMKMIRKEKPDFVFMGGDLLPHTPHGQLSNGDDAFIHGFLLPKFNALKKKMDCAYPEIFIIPGNDDQKLLFRQMEQGETDELWRNLHNKCIVIGKYRLYGYACVPPTPFLNKDWDRFDISDEIEKGCIAPIDGYFSVPPDHDPAKDTIETDLKQLVNNDTLDCGVFLFHSPPYNTQLDLAAFHSDGNPLVVHAGSKAIRNFIDEKQPYLTLHGHIHESAGISGQWKQTLGRTLSFSAAHHGPELALITFELHDPASASRRLLKT